MSRPREFCHGSTPTQRHVGSRAYCRSVARHRQRRVMIRTRCTFASIASAYPVISNRCASRHGAHLHRVMQMAEDLSATCP